MNENATKIQAVINTLQTMKIEATEDNLKILLSCYQVLGEVRDAITNQDIRVEVHPDADNHAE